MTKDRCNIQRQKFPVQKVVHVSNRFRSFQSWHLSPEYSVAQEENGTCMKSTHLSRYTSLFFMSSETIVQKLQMGAAERASEASSAKHAMEWVMPFEHSAKWWTMSLFGVWFLRELFFFLHLKKSLQHLAKHNALPFTTSDNVVSQMSSWTISALHHDFLCVRNQRSRCLLLGSLPS